MQVQVQLRRTPGQQLRKEELKVEHEALLSKVKEGREIVKLHKAKVALAKEELEKAESSPETAEGDANANANTNTNKNTNGAADA